MNDLNSSVADQHINAAPGFDDFGNARHDLGFIGHVHGHADGFKTLGTQFSGGGFSGVFVEVGNSDFGAFPGVSACNFLADATGCTRHECDFILEFHGFVPGGGLGVMRRSEVLT